MSAIDRYLKGREDYILEHGTHHATVYVSTADASELRDNVIAIDVPHGVLGTISLFDIVEDRDYGGEPLFVRSAKAFDGSTLPMKPGEVVRLIEARYESSPLLFDAKCEAIRALNIYCASTKARVLCERDVYVVNPPAIHRLVAVQESA